MSQEEGYSIVRTLSSGKIYKRTDGILVLRQMPDRDIVTVDELKEQLDTFIEIQKGEHSPLLVVVDKLKKLENDEKRFLISTIEKFASKVGVVAKTPIPAFIFNVLFYLSNSPVPCKVFNNEAEALAWLGKK
ncbi:MAG: hypothetical protein K0S44_3204 [Bacteroidetes bacterium]|jgi:hypothetical protein|nr:hypothetical protein [Bacteroidota bacterium]